MKALNKAHSYQVLVESLQRGVRNGLSLIWQVASTSFWGHADSWLLQLGHQAHYEAQQSFKVVEKYLHGIFLNEKYAEDGEHWRRAKKCKD